MKTTLKFLLLLLTTLPAVVTAQTDTLAVSTNERSELINTAASDYARIQLPALQTLIDNARMRSPQVQVYEVNREVEERELKTIRRTWLKHIKANASYSYGSSDMISQQYYNDQYPVVRNVSGSEQSWWNVGANIALPFDEIFNRRNRIKQQQKKIESIQYEADRWHDDVALKIIDCYTRAVQYLAQLESAAAAMIMAKAQYEFSKTDFVNGKLNAQALSYQKNIETVSIREYELIRAELNRALLSLEVLSKTPIITPEKEFYTR